MASAVCELVGLLRDVQYQRCRLILQELAVEHTQLLPHLHGVTESEYLALLESHKAAVPRAKHAALQRSASPFVIVNGTAYVEGEDALVAFAAERTQLPRDEIVVIAAFGAGRGVFAPAQQLALAEEALQAKAKAAAKQALFRARQLSGNAFVFLTFAVDGVVLPRVEVELFHRVCPRTCSNFVAFCEGKVADVMDETRLLGYKSCAVHRVVPGGWLQAGDVAHDGQGDGPCRSLYGRSFEDESFAVSHNAVGVVVLAFGRVVSGLHTVLTIGGLETLYERPCVPCAIADCGVIASTSD
ncbi:hypothetical protein PybrP1_002110 [[Pythium] brassicae (nom. inval.)]|nr:hypothetical protein PybrP1_002110 [[Pythium] brassicae (nom. inval.)]